MRAMCLLFYLLPFLIQAQDSLNQRTPEGFKTGKWMDSTRTGAIQSIKFFETTERPMQKNERFFYDLPLDKDTMVYYTACLWEKRFEYDTLNQLQKTVFKSKKGTFYRYGTQGELSWKPQVYEYTALMGSVLLDSIVLQNRSLDTLVLQVNCSPQITCSDSLFKIPPKSTFPVSFLLSPAANDQQHAIRFSNAELSLQIEVYSFAYHLSSSMLQKVKTIQTAPIFTFYRNETEGYLKVFDKRKKEVLQAVSLAHEKTVIDLSHLPPGSYWCCFYDFKHHQKIWKKLFLLKT